MSRKIILKVTRGPIKDARYTFEEHDMFIFGRSPECHAQLPTNDQKASRHHFLLEVNPPDAHIRDLGSLNGTFINDKRIGGRHREESPTEGARRLYPEIDLKNGDRVRVGETELTVCIECSTQCIKCGEAIAEEFESLCELADGIFLCHKCKKRIKKVNQKIQAKTIGLIYCSQCKKDASMEAGNRRNGEYVCQECREVAKADLSSLFKTYIKQTSSGTNNDKSSWKIPEYEFIAELDKGERSAIYLTRHESNGSITALKLLLADVAIDEHSRQLFEKEIIVTLSLHHQNIVLLTDCGSLGNTFYFAMEYCQGGNIVKLMQERGGKLRLEEAGSIILQALDGLAHAHEQGFVHRNIKPTNILMSAKKDGIAKIADFGLAKSLQKTGLSGITITREPCGTTSFMPREQLINFKHFKPISDIWSMAATFYYMLTSQLPRDFTKGQDPIRIILQEDSIPIRDRDSKIPQRVAEVIDHALIDKPEDRFQTALEFKDQLADALCSY